MYFCKYKNLYFKSESISIFIAQYAKKKHTYAVMS